MVLDRKSSQEYPVNAGVPQGSSLGAILFLLYINDLLDDVICNIAIYAEDNTLNSKYDWASDHWQQLELAFKLESDLQDTVGQVQEVTCWFQCRQNSAGFIWPV